MCTMFLQDQTTRITTDAVLEALGNPHDREILALAQETPITAQGVIRETGIPKSTVYRRIDRLTEQGLLEASDGRLHNGHVIDRYRTSIHALSMAVVDGQVQATWERVDHEPPSHQQGNPPSEQLVAAGIDP